MRHDIQILNPVKQDIKKCTKIAKINWESNQFTLYPENLKKYLPKFMSEGCTVILYKSSETVSS